MDQHNIQKKEADSSNYLPNDYGHVFKPWYPAENETYFICCVCNIIVYKLLTNDITMSSANKDYNEPYPFKLNITCNERIIQSIIE